MRPLRFFWHVFFLLVIFVLIGSSLFGFFLYRQLSESMLEAVTSDLRKENDLLVALAQNSPDILSNPQRILNAVHTEDRVTIISPDGKVVADNWARLLGKEDLDNHANRPEVQAALKGSPGISRRFSKTVNKEMMYYAVPVFQNGNLVFVLRLSFALTMFEQRMSEVRQYLTAAAALSILLSLPFAYFLSRAGTRHIETLRSAAHRLAEGELDTQIPEVGSYEFQQLSGDLNRMSNRLREMILSIRQQHTQQEMLLARMVEGVLAVDRHGKAVFANAAFCRMFGLVEDRVPGKSILEIIRNDQLSDFIATLLRDASAEQSREIRIPGTDGERFFSVQTSTIQENRDRFLLLVFHDITGFKRLEQVRRDFVANVSHELRTPLTALVGSTEILLDGMYHKPEESRKFLEIMDKQLRNIHNLVSDMLRLAAVEDSRMPFRKEVMPVKDLVADVLAPLQPLAMKKNQELKVTLPPEDLVLEIDPAQISAALTNLLDNAVKYTQEGGLIELKVLHDNSGVRLEVRDNGPGIPREQLPRVFERFYRVDKSRSREMGGTGLGLAIARHAIENHGGTLSVQSDYGRCTQFVIQLPETCVASTAQKIR